ncbi:MAG: dihydroneopterin aldolase [Candidatus Cloacimonetes bacterium]|jgi:dihydroneopterin aldolase|nr:dihydroneopterin aldolase [Candidatus Cloacimonadota bacterium]MBT4332427.1 dihydroneopterin aldolase [Candidatus Cloacimonadota bacterium]MBT4575678.1 dihydroneopterin aldolase [Candidatus Cloacimonadota bacterium]MBT5419522.1 dihydroneopterin aldolase [Candidatus Cloacimonadota bacterium]
MKIHLHEMVFYGYHGVHPEERKLGQRFIVNFSYETQQKHDNDIKNLEDTVDYTKVYAIIKHTLEEREFFLLEVCANTILDSILDTFPSIIYANVRIKKPSVPINGSLGSVEVEMERDR